MSVGATFRVAAAFSVFLGALLLASSWDGLYDALDLPQAQPALAPQIGGLAVLALGVLFWSGADRPELRRPLAVAGMVLYLGAAIAIASWLLFRERVELGIGDAGEVALIVAAVLFAALGVALPRAARA